MKTKEVWNPHTYMDTSPILAFVDLFPIQPQRNSQQDLFQDYHPTSVSFYLISFIQRLGTHFAMKDLGDLHFFLAIEAKCTSTALVLTQTKYTLDLLTRTHMQDSKTCPTPLVSSSKLSTYDGAPLFDVTEYRSIVGALQYFTITKPNICYAINQVCQFMQALTTIHLQAIKRILLYLKGSLGLGLTITPRPKTTFFAFSNATLLRKGWLSR
jgi:hypothetical protein